MLSDILWSIIFLVFIITGITRPYISLGCVIWIDILKPQTLSFSFLAGKPLSLIATAVFFISILINARKISLPIKKGSTFLIVLFMAWLTYCTYHAQFQAAAWFKYDYVIKTLFFSLFIPFVLNSRLKLEAFMGILVASIGYYTMIGGMRTFMGSGQYGEALVQSSAGDSGIAETSTLSMVSVFALALIYYIYAVSRYQNHIKYLKPLLLGLAFSCILTNIGTYARTGLVGLFVLFVLVTYYSKHKAKIILTACAAVIIAIPFLSADYLARMNTIKSADSESSALGRIVVWRWTLDYVSERPIRGGGFDAYHANRGQLQFYMDADQSIQTSQKTGKAFHNIFFEVLGESGYVGLSIFLAIILACFRLNYSTTKNNPKDSWQTMLARVINISLIIFCTCGMFIGVAYSPWLYYFIGIAASLHNIKPEPSRKNNRESNYPAFS